MYCSSVKNVLHSLFNVVHLTYYYYNVTTYYEQILGLIKQGDMVMMFVIVAVILAVI